MFICLLLTRGWSKEETVRYFQSTEASVLWSHHEETKQLPGKKDNARNYAMYTQGGIPHTVRMYNINTWTGLSVDEYRNNREQR